MSKRKICVVTGTRAEYGLLYWVMKGLHNDSSITLQLCVTGTHLSPEFGLTYQTIEQDGFQIDKSIEILLSSDTGVGAAKAVGLGVISFSEALADLQPDLVLVLGDRFELLAVASATLLLGIPLAHCHGGELTEGAIDDAIRHSITKMAHIHFAAIESYRRRVIQLGEHPDRVFTVGALGIENIHRLNLLDRPSLEEELGFRFRPRNIVVTYHPTTLEQRSAAAHFEALLQVLGAQEELGIVFTMPNADPESRVIIKAIKQFTRQHAERVVYHESLGQLRYLSLLKQVDAVVGNSSSGLLEAPSFRVATINIGNRQKGREQVDSVINCAPDKEAIGAALAQALSSEFNSVLAATNNSYDRGNASEAIISVLKKVDLQRLTKKKFYDLPDNLS